MQFRTEIILKCIPPMYAYEGCNTKSDMNLPHKGYTKVT